MGAVNEYFDPNAEIDLSGVPDMPESYYYRLTPDEAGYVYHPAPAKVPRPDGESYVYHPAPVKVPQEPHDPNDESYVYRPKGSYLWRTTPQPDGYISERVIKADLFYRARKGTWTANRKEALVYSHEVAQRLVEACVSSIEPVWLREKPPARAGC